MEIVNDFIITKISLISFLFLFSSIFYLDSIHNLDSVNIENISFSDINKNLKIEVKILRSSLSKNTSTQFMEVYDSSGKIKVILFNSDEKLNLSLNYEIIGKVVIYNNSLELIANQINELE